MADALENPAAGTSYLQYFRLERAPFARLARPASIYHAEQYSLLMAHLAAATTATDRLVVLRGVAGAGKTTLLNRFLSGLDDQTSFATIDEQCDDAVEFHRSFLQQIGFGNIGGKLGELQTISRQFLVNRAAAGDAVLLVIDNTHLIRPAVLDQLRWLARAEHDQRRVLSVILAGNPELRSILDSPAMSDLVFRNQVDFHIRAYTGEETADYVHYRLMLAGGSGKIAITPEAHALLYRFTGGIPRLINRVGTSILAEACRRQTTSVGEALVRAVAEAEQLPINVVPFKGRGRRRSDPDFSEAPRVADFEERIQPRQAGEDDARYESVAARPDSDAEHARLLEKIEALSAELGVMKADRDRAGMALESRNIDIAKLRQTLAAQTKEADRLSRAARDSAKEITKLRQDVAAQGRQLAENRGQLQRREDELRDLATQLKDQKRHARSAAAQATRAGNRIERLEHKKAELEEATRGLRAELDEASRRIRELADTERRLEDSEAARKAMMTSVAELESLHESIEERNALIESLKNDLLSLRAGSTQTQARPAGTLEPVPARVADADEAGSAEIVAFEVARLDRVENVHAIVDPDGRIMVGRSEDSDLRLDSEFVSRHHALIFCTPGHTYIEDLHSFNGTIVNGKGVTQSRLRPDDTIIIGDFRIRPLAATD